MPEVYKSSDAASNIKDMINAMADAQKAQTEVQKQVILSKIGQQQELQTNKAKLQQGVESNINQKQANVNWLEQMGNQETPTGQSQGNGLGNNGVADSGTPAANGAPSVGPQGPGPSIPQTPPMSMANPAQQPANTAASQLTMPQVSQPVAKPQPPSTQYTNLGYTPVEAQQLAQTRQKAGQPVNMADRAYVMALQKVKAGTASQGEIDMVNKMNPQSQQAVPSTNLEVQPTSQMAQGKWNKCKVFLLVLYG